MYKIYAGDQVIHHPNLFDEGYACIEPKLEIEVNAHGSATFALAPDHPCYEDIADRTTIIRVLDDTEELFRGRVIETERDFYNRKVVYVEGELAFLCDSVFRPFGYSGGVKEFFAALIDNHNSQVDETRQFVVGEVTVEDPNDYIVRSSETPMTTWEAVKTRLVELMGGYIRTRLEGGVRYIDYLADFPTHNMSQTIRFGDNLLDLEEYITAANVVTCLVPYGAEYEDGDAGYTEQPENGSYNGNRVTVESVNGGKDYIENATGVALYGQVWGTNTWDDVTEPDNLLTKATAYLEANILSSTGLTINAVDLHLVDVDTDRIKVGTYVKAYSRPHDISVWLLCTKQKIDLAEPDNTEITLGASAQTMSGSASAMSSALSGYATTGSLSAAVAKFKNLFAECAQIEYLEANYIKTDDLSAKIASLGYLMADSAVIANLEAAVAAIESAYITTARVDELLADYALVSDLEAAVANIDDLTADVASIKMLYATVEHVDDLLAGYAQIEDLNALTANITNLLSSYATINYLQTNYTTTEDLRAAYATIADLNTASASIETLNTNVAAIQYLLAGNESVDMLEAIHLTADNVVIDDAVIMDLIAKDAVIGNLLAGEIYTNQVRIYGDESKLLSIVDNTIQISDGALVRVQIGEDGNGDYNLYLWGADGSLLWNATGVTESGLNDGIIKDVAVADDASISGYKLDIASVAECLSADGSLVVDAAQVTINNTTLDAAYTTIVQTSSAVQEALASLTAEKTVQDIEAYYALTSAGEVLLDSDGGELLDENGEALQDFVLEVDWTTEPLTASEGQYLWMRYLVTYTDETTEWTAPVCLTDTALWEKTSVLVTEFEVVQGQIAAKIWLSDIESASDELGNSITTLSDQYSSVVETVESITDTVGQMQSVLETKADGSTVQSLTSRVTTVEETVDGLSSSVVSVQEALETKADGSTVSTLSSQYTALSQTVSGIQEDIASIQKTVTDDYSELSEKYTSISATVSGIQTDIGDLQTTVTDNYAAISDRYASLSLTVEGLTGEMSDVQSLVTSNYAELSQQLLNLSATTEGFGASLTSLTQTVETLADGMATLTVQDSTLYYAVTSEGEALLDSDGEPLLDENGETILDFVLETDWTTDPPEVGDGQYLWIRYYKLYTDGTEEWTTPVCVTDAVTRAKTMELTTEITALQGEIDLRVTQTEVETAITSALSSYSKTSEITSAIELAVGSVNSRVSDLEAEVETKADGTTVESLTSRVTSVEQTIESITSKVSSLETLDGRVTTAESVITQLSTSIESKVDVDGVISSINQSAETVKILASRIDLAGAVTISSLASDVTDVISAAADGKIFYGTSSTAAGTAAKTVTCTGVTELYDGLTVRVTFGYGSTVDEPTLNVNGLGAKYLAFGNAQVTSINLFRWAAGAIITFVCIDNGDDYLWEPQGYPRSYYGTSSTAAGTAAKTASVSDFVLCKGVTVAVKFSNTTAVATPTLNIASTGACTIYAYDATLSASSVYNWGAGTTVVFAFDGRYWRMAGGTSDGVLANWCYENNTTYIDGAKIYTGTITAKQLNVEDIFAQNVTATGEIFFSNSKYKISAGDDDVRIYAYDTLTLVGGANLNMYNEVGYITVSSPGEVSLTSDYNVVLTARNTGSAGYINLNATNGVKAPSMIQSGAVSITPSAANTPTGKTVTFSTAFPGVPRVVATAQSTVPGTGVTEVSATNITTTGFDLYLTRSGTDGTAISWIAVYTPS